MPKLLVEYYAIENDCMSIPIETYMIVFMYKYLGIQESVELVFVKQRPQSQTETLLVNKKFYFIYKNDINDDIKTIINIKPPVFIQDHTFQIGGLCAVNRELILFAKRFELLGFKLNSLIAPAESSIWTRFCEYDIIDAMKFFLNTNTTKIPIAIIKFESHLHCPVRAHNIYKLAREFANENKKIKNLPDTNDNKSPKDINVKDKCNDQIDCTIPIEKLNLEHTFAEGLYMSIVDVMIYPCITLLFSNISQINILQKIFPAIYKWLNGINLYDKNLEKTFTNLLENTKFLTEKKLELLNLNKNNIFSIYKKISMPYKAKNQNFTRQEDIAQSLESFNLLDIKPTSKSPNKFFETPFDWDILPSEAFPEFGQIPEKRLQRKKQQLENMAVTVKNLAKDDDIIVEFCSGNGHLGIILACLLPKCKILFIENKSFSLNYCKKRVKSLNLKNCEFYQCNIKYFQGDFNIGVSLHACGSATDIVLMNCIRKQAKFVCCPCCYGSIRSTSLNYPLSKTYSSKLTLKAYMHLTHSADQFHGPINKNCNDDKSKQGELCMDIIDTDRKTLAEENSYSVILTRLQPPECNIKNRLLIGVI